MMSTQVLFEDVASSPTLPHTKSVCRAIQAAKRDLGNGKEKKKRPSKTLSPPPMIPSVRDPHLLPRLLSYAGASPARPQAAALLELSGVEKVLPEVRAGDVRVFPVGEGGLPGGACVDSHGAPVQGTDSPGFPFPCLPLEKRKEGSLDPHVVYGS
ncbi:hypothetical protein GQ55_3G417300 [Panicum hallii var. hallii]|uniref:Uncharacterized protein n=1 Tax=Panicum hallii var. hallii TaxID=1504633 RepID=A0A2T7EHB7_9POAL|nr:hypothetical protein GQ55_3G417300 [Panicum hallii var. hallii]